MNEVIEFFKLLTSDLPTLIKTVGLIGIFLIIFAESGLLIGFFLPGDSLLFTAGFLAVTNIAGLDIRILLIGCFIAAVIGDNVGYTFGARVGHRLFTKDNSLLFNKKNIIKAQEFYEKHGALTILIARFMPVIRTFVPILAGVAKMNYKVFFLYNVVGGALWSTILLLAGYYLGKIIPNIDHYILPIIAIIIFISIAPSIYHLLKHQLKSK
jgi:membrane-associated protein